MTDLADSASSGGDGRVLGLTRAGVWVLFVLAAANGLFLYFLPGTADTDYAWSIKPGVNAAFIGAGFLAGTLATGLVLWKATRWRSFSLLPPALWVLATTLLVATLIHEDRFKWDYAPTWVWTFVYAVVPLAIPFLVVRQRRVAEPLPPADPALRTLRILSGIAGVAPDRRRRRALHRARGARRALGVGADAAARRARSPPGTRSSGRCCSRSRSGCAAPSRR